MRYDLPSRKQKQTDDGTSILLRGYVTSNSIENETHSRHAKFDTTAISLLGRYRPFQLFYPPTFTMISSKNCPNHRRSLHSVSQGEFHSKTTSSLLRTWRVTIAMILLASSGTSGFFAHSSSSMQNGIRSDLKVGHGNYAMKVNRSKTTLLGMTTSSPNPSLGAPICVYHQVDVPSSEKNPVPRQAISVEDLTPMLQALLAESGMVNGLVTVISRHTTTSLTINEWESRLAEDIAETFLKLVPPDERSVSPASQKDVTYKHNDIHLRPFGDSSDKDNYDINSEEANRCRENGWDVDDPVQLQAWRDQEPINAHSHLLSILGGSGSESIPVVEGKMVLGQWQSVLLLDLDGPRDRTVGVQLMGYS